jgi:GDP-4-dehydro-6-deoxy-D-mannose reductase
MNSAATLVTGATGFAGRHLLHHLQDEAPLVAWQHPGGRPHPPGGLVDWRSVDLTDAAAVDLAIADVAPARLFHLAGAPNVAASWGHSASYLRVNALGTHHVLDAVRRHAPRCRVLVISSGQIYRPSDDPIREDAPLGPSSPYGFSKLAQDQLALRAAHDDRLDIVVARPFNHTGPGQADGYAVPSFARQIARIESGLAPPELRVGNLDARRDITDVRDVVEAYRRLMAHGIAGHAYNVCSGRAWRIGDLLDELRQLTTAEVTIAVDPDALRPSDTPIVQGDASRIRAELGWIPNIAVEQTLRDTLDWWRQGGDDQVGMIK